MSKRIDPTLFSAHSSVAEACPSCGAQLQMRQGKRGAFLGCSQYPTCDYLRPLHNNDGHVVKALGVPCPECSAELVLRQGRYGMFIGCSMYPECHHIESLDAAQSNDQAKQILPCPECHHGHIVERKSRFGKLFYACDAYPKCKFSLNQQPITGCCEVCSYPLLIEKIRSNGTRYQCASRKCQHLQEQRTVDIEKS